MVQEAATRLGVISRPGPCLISIQVDLPTLLAVRYVLGRAGMVLRMSNDDEQSLVGG